jgi:hypothetical protein
VPGAVSKGEFRQNLAYGHGRIGMFGGFVLWHISEVLAAGDTFSDVGAWMH